MVLCTVNIIIVMQVIAKMHKAIIQDIVYNTNAVNVACRKKTALTFAVPTIVIGLVAKQTNAIIVLIASNTNAMSQIAQVVSNTILMQKIIVQAMIVAIAEKTVLTEVTIAQNANVP